MTKVYDCFIFHNEFELLRIRLRELAESVDVFVLIEGSLTHTGHPKPFYFEEQKDLFTDYSHKIVHRGVTLPLDNANTWGREILQRTAINYTLAELGPDEDDIILSSDIDEIAHARAIEEYRCRGDICCLEEKTYHYNLNCLMAAPTLDPKICRYRQLKEFGAADLRYCHARYDIPVLRDAGWHLSFMGGTEKIIEKLRSYAHYDERDPNTRVYLSRENVEQSVRDRKSLFLRDDVKYLKVKDFSHMPRYIMENVQHFIDSGWILER